MFSTLTYIIQAKRQSSQDVAFRTDFFLLRMKSIQSFRIVTFRTLELLATIINREQSSVNPIGKMRTSTYSELRTKSKNEQMYLLKWIV